MPGTEESDFTNTVPVGRRTKKRATPSKQAVKETLTTPPKKAGKKKQG